MSNSNKQSRTYEIFNYQGTTNSSTELKQRQQKQNIETSKQKRNEGENNR